MYGISKLLLKIRPLGGLICWYNSNADATNVPFSKNLSKTCIRCRVDKVVTSFKVSLDLIFGRTHNEKKSFNALGALCLLF